VKKFFVVIFITLWCSTSFAATAFNVSIKSSGGDYTTLASAESALDEDLTAATIKVFSFDAATDTIDDGDAVSTDGGATTGVCVHSSYVSNQILIKTISGGTFNDNDVVTTGTETVTLSDSGNDPSIVITVYNDLDLTADVVFDGGTFDADNSYTVQGDTSAWDGTYANAVNIEAVAEGYGAITLSDEYIYFKYFGINGNSEATVNFNNDTIYVVNVIISGGGFMAGNHTYPTHSYCINCVSLNSAASAFFANMGGRMALYNCSAINPTTYGFYLPNNTNSHIEIYNSVACSSGTADFYETESENPTGDYVASCDNTGDDWGFTHDYVNIVEANEFESGDYHLKSTNTIGDLGYDYSGTTNINFDIDEVIIGGIWPIGADEYVAPVSTSFTTIINGARLNGVRIN